MTAEAATPDQEGELGDVETPDHVPAHPGDGQTGVHLPQPADPTRTDQHEQKSDPCPVRAVSSERLLKHGRPFHPFDHRRRRGFLKRPRVVDDVVDLRLGPETRLAPNGHAFGQQPTHLGVRVVEIAEDDLVVRARRDAGGFEAAGEALLAEGALLDHPPHPRRGSRA